MKWSDWLVPGSCVVLESCVIAFVFRWWVWRSFPVYSTYLVFVLLRDLLLNATRFYPNTYFLAYWLSAPMDIPLTICAALESFWRLLGIFRLLRWFRFVLPTAIVVALAYSAYRGYRFPPVEVGPAGAAIIHASVTSHYVVLSIAVLFFLLAALFHVPWRIHEHRLLLGFGVASLAFAFGGSVRAVFGSNSAAISEQAPAIGYLVALLIWLSAVVHPVAKDGAISEPPVEIVTGLKLQLRNLRSFVRNNTR